ncbi:MAG: ATP-binding protein [Actinobacteria bacterium]|nr:ATP-binding protein [Actinomycetota bacterium]
MPSRIGLIGGECTGKSTLATALGRHLPSCVVPEVLREVVDRLGRPPLPGEQAGIMAEQSAREDAMARACELPWLVADPAPLMTAVYSQLYFADDCLVSPAVEHARGYDLIIWCGADIPWTPDGVQRDGPAARDRADEIISTLVREDLRSLGSTVIKVTGGLDDRVATVLAALG